MKRLFALPLSLACLVSLSCPIAHADTRPWQDDSTITALFEKEKVSGTFVVYDVSAGRMIGHDRKRAQTRYLPASTFKIPNSLIGLDTGAVKSVDEVLPYGGKPQPVKAWEHDMNLRQAIKISNIPIYQELARRITLERMRTAVKQLDYGNTDIGQTVDQFWLKGPLKISAVEQTLFLAKLAQDQLPFSHEAQEAVREITLLERGDGWELHGKTGWTGRAVPNVGWWVGWVKKGNRIYSFALNLNDDDQGTRLPKREALGKACLKTLGLLE